MSAWSTPAVWLSSTRTGPRSRSVLGRRTSSSPATMRGWSAMSGSSGSSSIALGGGIRQGLNLSSHAPACGLAECVGCEQEGAGETRGRHDRRQGDPAESDRRVRRWRRRPPVRVVLGGPVGGHGPVEHAVQRRRRGKRHGDVARRSALRRRTSRRRAARSSRAGGSAVLRSPSQSSAPDTANRTASAACTLACSLLAGVEAALRRVLPAQPAQVVRRETLEIAPGSAERRRSPGVRPARARSATRARRRGASP